jgi:hypothetical protein
MHSVGTGALALQKGTSRAHKNELANRASLRGGLLFQLPVEGGRDVDGRANRILFHERIVSRMSQIWSNCSLARYESRRPTSIS